MNNIVFLNDKFLPRDKAKVSVFDRGFIYGDGVFETLHSYNGKVFAFDLHFTRLSEGIKALAIPIRLKEDYLLSCIKKLLSRNNFNNTDANIRITVTRGTDYGSLAPSKSLKPTLAITAKPFNPPPDQVFKPHSKYYRHYRGQKNKGSGRYIYKRR